VAVLPVRLPFAAERFVLRAVVLPVVPLPVAPLPVVLLPVALPVVEVDADEPVALRLVLAVAEPVAPVGVHGVCCAPVCAPPVVVVFEPAVPGCEVCVGCVDDVLPVPCPIAGTASAKLSAAPPAKVMNFLLNLHLQGVVDDSDKTCTRCSSRMRYAPV
jgi:hypothetical protein